LLPAGNSSAITAALPDTNPLRPEGAASKEKLWIAGPHTMQPSIPLILVDYTVGGLFPTRITADVFMCQAVLKKMQKIMHALNLLLTNNPLRPGGAADKILKSGQSK
jgi:hypothetical protein